MGIMYVNMTGMLPDANGCICVDTRDRAERKIGYARAVELLGTGTSPLIFPEGAYNVFENLPVMKTFPGAVRMARRVG